jgi:AcrR family transcriptional regulator
MVNTVTHEPDAVRKTRKEILSEWRHKEILQAARRIFASLGYAAASVEDIAKEAGMAKGTVYLYFKSKEEVFVAVLASQLESLTNQTIEGMSAAETFDERLTVFLNLRLAYLRNNEDFLRIYMAEFDGCGSRSTLISELVDRLYWRGIDSIRQCVEQAIARDELRPVHAEAAAVAIYDIAKGFVLRHLRGRTHLPPEEDLAFTHSLILNGLRNK